MQLMIRVLFFRCCGFFRRSKPLAHWVPQTDFSEIIIDNDIVSDHLPDALLKEITKVIKMD